MCISYLYYLNTLHCLNNSYYVNSLTVEMLKTVYQFVATIISLIQDNENPDDKPRREDDKYT